MNAKFALGIITTMLMLGLTVTGCSTPDQSNNATEQHRMNNQEQLLDGSMDANKTIELQEEQSEDSMERSDTTVSQENTSADNVLLIGDTTWGRIVGIGGLLYIEQADGERKEIGEAGRKKHGALLSDDSSKLLYAYEDAMLSGSFPQLGVYHLTDNSEVKLFVENEHGRQMNAFYWGSANTVLVEGHINPSVTGYVLYNDRTGEVISAAGGMLHQVLADEQSLLMQMSPHWQWESTETDLELAIATADGQQFQLYREQFEQPITVVDIAMSDSMSTLAIWLLDGTDGTAQLLLVTVDPQTWKVSSTSKHAVPTTTTGNIEFNEQARIIMIGEKEQFPIP